MFIYQIYGYVQQFLLQQLTTLEMYSFYLIPFKTTYTKGNIWSQTRKDRPFPLSPFVTKFAYYRLLTAKIANGLSREKQNTSVKKKDSRLLAHPYKFFSLQIPQISLYKLLPFLIFRENENL